MSDAAEDNEDDLRFYRAVVMDMTRFLEIGSKMSMVAANLSWIADFLEEVNDRGLLTGKYAGLSRTFRDVEKLTVDMCLPFQELRNSIERGGPAK